MYDPRIENRWILFFSAIIKKSRGIIMKKRVCPRCGNEIQKGESFCRNCGNVMPKEKDHTYIYVGVAMFVVIFIVIIGLGLLGSESDETKNIIVDDLSEIVQDEDRAEDYLDTTIHTSGYLFRKEDVMLAYK